MSKARGKSKPKGKNSHHDGPSQRGNEVEGMWGMQPQRDMPPSSSEDSSSEDETVFKKTRSAPIIQSENPNHQIMASAKQMKASDLGKDDGPGNRKEREAAEAGIPIDHHLINN
jgi:hypothetical protein